MAFGNRASELASMTQLEARDPTHVLKHNWANEKLLKEDSYGFLSIHRASPQLTKNGLKPTKDRLRLKTQQPSKKS